MEEQEDLVLREKNIAFATLLSFANSMHSLELPHKLIHEFILKWSSFYSLDKEMEMNIMVGILMLGVFSVVSFFIFIVLL